MAESSVKQQIVDKLKESSNILVTVNSSPSVDELSAALGITLLLNKLNKHATAVFSGDMPPAIEFLNPEKTFEHTVDSLRDFIIALDKEKADHLRYKVDGDMVKIFITPYRTTINENDLDFSQGDYNVEAVLAIGVQSEADLDHALESHGRILHDATVSAVSLGEPTNLGGIEWADGGASSYSEMIYTLADSLKSDKKLIDEQIANAFLTGIVAATDRFSNSKTTSNVMTIAAQLMSAGANQQLIATKLQEEQAISTPDAAPSSNGDLKEGESAAIDRSSQLSSKKESGGKEAGDAAGALSISHVPQGSVDEVAKEVGKQRSNEARSRAEEELAKQAQEVVSGDQNDATETAEQKLAEELAATGAVAPAAESLQNDLTQASAEASRSELRGAVKLDQWKARSDEEAAEPSLGGTLNATTEQAAEDKRQQIADDRNRTILSHGSGGGYATGAPTYQAPLNAAMATDMAEPTVRDVFAEGSTTDVTAHVDAIQPPAPSAPAPTLAEIDAQNRTSHAEAMDAVQQALGAPSQPTSPVSPPVSGVPSLPPLPPMPDFSTLPPLPGVPSPGTTSVPDALGAILPPSDAPVVPPPINVDPNQFRIPGQ